MKNLKGSKTEENLMNAFAGESMARNKYDYYASQAKKDGYVQIADIFSETAANEREHAKIWFRLLHGGIADTRANLTDAANGEHFEWSEMYKTFAEEADAEGFTQIAELFRKVADIERSHEERYVKLAVNIDKNEVFQKGVQVVWVCLNCGHIVVGDAAPEVCPVCAHPRSFFAMKAENY